MPRKNLIHLTILCMYTFMSMFVLLCIYQCTVCVNMQFETAMIGTLDELVAAGHGDRQYQELFYEMSVFSSGLTCF